MLPPRMGEIVLHTGRLFIWFWLASVAFRASGVYGQELKEEAKPFTAWLDLFHYSGWLRAQKIIPASALQIGINRLTLRLPTDTGSVAVRALELRLK